MDGVLQAIMDAIAPLDATAMTDAEELQAQLTKPPGSLGVLEPAAATLCGIQAQCPPTPLRRPVVAVFAGDHGVHAQGVTPWPQEVTTRMVENICQGGAAVNVLARQVGAQVHVVDMGVAGDLAPSVGHIDHRVRRGTSDLAGGPAMTTDEALEAILAGVSVADRLAEDGYDCFLTGDLGIANTTASAALVCAFTGADPLLATGRGSGADDATMERKVAVVSAALAQRPAGADPVEVLASFGGFEHAGLTGFLLGAAARRIPVLLDGVTAGAAALVARGLVPLALDYCFAGHRSAEPGHVLCLHSLGLRPLVDLELRLGEGTGALLAFPIVQAAGATLREMATFDAAGVPRKDER